MKQKPIKGYIGEEFLARGWRGKDSAIFVYRRKLSDKNFVRISITLSPKKTK